MIKVSIYWLNYLYWIALIPVYIVLCPLCMISSSFFDWTISWILQDQTLTLIIILIVQWGLSILLILELMIYRTNNTIFFYQFVFFLVLANFVLVGITFTLLQRSDIQQQFSIKICTSLLLVWIAQKGKRKLDTPEKCIICYEPLENDTMILKCEHIVHETCLWNWIYQKEECPICRKKY